MCRDRGLEFNEETTVIQLEEMLSQPAETPQGEAPQPQGREDLNETTPETEDEKSSDDDGAVNSVSDDDGAGDIAGDIEAPIIPPDPETEDVKEDPIKDTKLTPPLPQGRDEAGKSIDSADEEKKPEVVKDITKLYNADIKFMKEWVWKQPLVRFMIPMAESEKPGAYDTWMRNGYRLQVMKGVFVDLPKPVADDFATHYNIDMETGRNFRLDLNADKQNALS